MDCTRCRFAEENDCPGCMQGQLFEDEECEVYSCCAEKGIEHCGQCGDFPCDTLKAISYDKETGDGGARILRLKAISDKAYVKKSNRQYCIVLGSCLGIILGFIAGAFSQSYGTSIFAGLLLGACFGIIIGLGREKK